MKTVKSLVMVALLATGAPAFAGDDDEKKADKPADAKKKAESVYQAAVPKDKDSTTKVWTNADLAGLGNAAFATTPSAPSPGDGPGPGGTDDSLEWLQKQERLVATRQQRIAAAQAALEAAELRLANLEKQLLATVNPFSARPQLSDEELEERRTQQETAEQRFARTKKTTEDARAAVEAARTALQRAKAGR